MRIKYIIEKFERMRDINGNRRFAIRIIKTSSGKSLEMKDYSNNFNTYIKSAGIDLDEVHIASWIYPKRAFDSMVKHLDYVSIEKISNFIKGD